MSHPCLPCSCLNPSCEALCLTVAPAWPHGWPVEGLALPAAAGGQWMALGPHSVAAWHEVEGAHPHWLLG